MEFRKHLFILRTIEQLQKSGSWTGKTHVQKSLYLVQALTRVAVPFEFVLYMHGPYSFDVEEELAQMKSYTAIEIAPVPAYGVIIRPGNMAPYVKDKANLTAEEESAIERVCRFVGNKRVAELEKTATAAWIRTKEHRISPVDVANRLNELKPHIPVASAKIAYEQLREAFADVVL